MIEPSTRPLWRGRTTAVIAVVLLALNLRTAVASLSPILALVADDVPLGGVEIGLLGMLAPLAFAVSGFVAPAVARRLGLEFTMALACAAMVVGPLVRAIADNYSVLVLGSIVAFVGMGFSNILLPPVIKKYFPDRVGLLTAAYVTIMSISASAPPLVAAPLAEAGGWRVSAGAWGVFALAALVPWIAVWLQQRARSRRATAEGAVVVVPPALLGRLFRSRIAWALALLFAITSINVYGMFNWLPEILVDGAGVTPAEGGALLALYGIVGLPLGLLVPIIVPRVRNVGWLITLSAACFLAGYAGLLLAPTTLTGLWVVLANMGSLTFPLALVLINLRTRTHEGAIALSGFVQGAGYAVGALGPLVIGILHDATGGWTAPMVFLIVTALVMLVTAVMLARPRFVEDELAPSDGR